MAKNRRLEIFILARNFPEDKRQDIERSICANRPEFEPTDLHWIVPDLTLRESLHVEGHVSLDSCSRPPPAPARAPAGASAPQQKEEQQQIKVFVRQRKTQYIPL